MIIHLFHCEFLDEFGQFWTNLDMFELDRCSEYVGTSGVLWLFWVLWFG